MVVKLKSIVIAGHLNDAMESLRKCRCLVEDKETMALLYHAGMTIRTMQQRLDPEETTEPQEASARRHNLDLSHPAPKT